MTNYASYRTTNISTRSSSIRIDFTRGGWRQFARVNRTLGSRFIKAFVLRHEVASYIAAHEDVGIQFDTICQEIRYDDGVYLLLKRVHDEWLITDVSVDESETGSSKEKHTFFPILIWRCVRNGLRTALTQTLCGWGCSTQILRKGGLYQ
ncbi:MAG: hypothetical protein PHC36_00605 [Eubacteriales bacterium]|nr:hypothetical protein [Eubacteriales bacterium]